MELRPPTAADADRIAELVESSMTASYRLSPQQIEDVVDSEFSEDALPAAGSDDNNDNDDDHNGGVTFVAETTAGDDSDVPPETVIGYVEGHVDGDRGELTWLFVDPEHRGRGVGTALFESARDALGDAGASTLVATTLEENSEGHQFFERFDLERVGEREVEVAEVDLVETLYADSAAVDVDAGRDHAGGAGDGRELPGTETHDGATTARTDDGDRVYLARDEAESGAEAPFLVAYVDEAHSERFGFYCANCGSLDVAMDDADRLDCPDCANEHATRSADSYDDSYL